MKIFTAKHIGLKVQDLIKGTSIYPTIDFLLQSQYWNKEKIEEYQLQKLQSLVEYASLHVPYYRELFKKKGIKSSNIKSTKDIKQIPILTKEIMRKEGERLLSDEFSSFRIKVGKTGGTTGSPIRVYKDQNNRSFTWGSYYRWYSWMSLKPSAKTVTFWGTSTVLKTSFRTKVYNQIKQLFSNGMVVNSFKMNEKEIPNIIAKIQKYKPELLKGYVSSLLVFAEYVEKKSIKFPSLKALSSTTETLLPHNRKYLEKVFGVPIFDQYGCGEVSAISYECGAHMGTHINQEHVICEILDENNEDIFEQTGRIVATDLDNYVMPVIRFENGDLGSLTKSDCSCGIKQPLLSSIEGRIANTITTKDGNKVHGVFFTDIFYELSIENNQLSRFQIQQQRESGNIIVVLEDSTKLKTEQEEALVLALKKFFVSAEIHYVQRIPTEKNGKFQYIKMID